MSISRINGVLFILSAPSGAGKTTLRNGLQQTPDFTYSISCTTRERREGEVEGVDYYFLSEEAFEEKVAAGEFLEHAVIHGNRYGTLRSTVLASLREGGDVVIDIDPQGAAQIRACEDAEIREAFVDLFLLPPSLSELRRRLEARGTESSQQIETRLRNAEEELAQWPHYRYAIPPGTVEEVLASVRAVMQAERMAVHRLRVKVDQLLTT